MAKKRRYSNNNRPNKRPVATPHAAAVARPAAEPYQKKPEQQYGPPFILLEDESKNTFEYRKGAWIPHAAKIAECRLDCQVKELSQKVNRMTRYEVRRPLPV